MGNFQFSLSSLESYYANKKRKVLEESKEIFQKASKIENLLKSAKIHQEELGGTDILSLERQIELRKNYSSLLKNSLKIKNDLMEPLKEAQMRLSRAMQQEKALNLLKEKEKAIFFQNEARKERIETEEFVARAFYDEEKKIRN